MLEIFTILAPVFLLMATGYALGHTRLFDEEKASALIAFVWYVAIPALLFQLLASRPLPIDELLLIASYYCAVFVVYGLVMLTGRLVFKQSGDEQGMFAFASCFANGGFIGIPILNGVYGDEGVRLLLILLSFHSLTLLPVTGMVIERYRAGRFRSAKVLSSLKGNPIILTLVIAFGWSAMGLPYPVWLDRVVALPAAAAAPVGLFAVGLSLTGVRLAGDLPQPSLGTLFKLILMPVTVYLVGRFVFALPPLWLGVVTLLAALPTGIMPYTFALKEGLAPRRVASIILLTVSLSPITLFITMWFLGVGA
jgi:malonate transporter